MSSAEPTRSVPLALVEPLPRLTPVAARRRHVKLGEEPLPHWRDSAACIGCDLNLFFPISSVGPAAARQVEQAKAVCAGCPVQAECLEWALEVGPEFGIFGGRTAEERRLLREQRRNRDPWGGPRHTLPASAPVVLVARDEESSAEALDPR